VWPTIATVVSGGDDAGPPFLWGLGLLLNVLYVFGLIRALVWLLRRANRRLMGPNASKAPLDPQLP
jgi:hypothetical protein